MCSSDLRRWEWTHINGIDVNDAGDIVFSCRNNDRVAVICHETGDLKFKFDQTHGQHNPTWVGENLLQIFDNGDDASRVIEVDISSGEIVWQFNGEPIHQFHSGHISGASRLWTGNTLVCEGTSGRLFEVTRNKEVVWEWINPFMNTSSKGNMTTSIYRADRYPLDHPALIDRDLNPDNFSALNRAKIGRAHV